MRRGEEGRKEGRKEGDNRTLCPPPSGGFGYSGEGKKARGKEGA
jgi:hypothetical protein